MRKVIVVPIIFVLTALAFAAMASATVFSTGELRYFTFESQQLNDRMYLRVNVASGNLLLGERDLHIGGTGLDLDIRRAWNSTSGPGWSTVNCICLINVGLSITKTIDFIGPTGYRVTFTQNPDGSFTSPPGIDATLVQHAAHDFTLTFNKTGEKYNLTYEGIHQAHLLKITSDVDKNGNRITYSYDPANDTPSSITDTQGRVTGITANSHGAIDTITDPSGRVYNYGYSPSDQLTKYTDPAGNLTTFDYDNKTNDLLKVTDPLGHVTTLTYDASHRVTAITRVTDSRTGTGPTTRYVYNAGNTVSTDPNGHTTTYFYDSQNRVTKVVDANGNTTQASYTANNDIATTTNALGAVTTYGYDGLNNLISAQSPTGATNRFGYVDAAHPMFVTSHTDPQGNLWAYSYDPNGNLSSKSEGAGQNPIRFTRNSNGTVATATDAKGAVTSFSYDGKGNLTGITHPAPLGSESFTYDGLSRVTSARDGAGHLETYTYDALDRLKTISYSDGSVVSYSYDADGNLTSMSDAGSTTSFSYDALNRLTQESLPGPKTIAYGYDAASSLTSFADSGGTVRYGYDLADRLTTLTEPNGKITNFSYDKNGNRTSISYPNGVAEAIAYDASERLTSIKATKGGTTLNSFSYSYVNPAGADTDLRSSVVDLAGNKTTSSYDILNRLVEAKTVNGAGAVTDDFQYTYDANGNRTSQTINGVVTNYTYNAANELTSRGGTAFTYDGNGNELSGSAGSLAYNVRDQTTNITPPGGSVVNFAYTGPTQALRTAAGPTSYTNSVLLGVTSETTAGATSYFTRGSDGDLIEERTPNGTYYYLYDGLGSIVGLTDGNGALANTYKYDPFGNLSASTGTVGNPWRFASYYFDSSTGLYKVGVRYYDPSLARWTQRDIVDQPLDEHGWNRYVYAGDDPTNLTDPTGLCWSGLCWASHAYDAATSFLHHHRWARCTLFVAGALGYGGEAFLVIREAKAAQREGKAVLTAIRLGRSGKVGTGASLSIIASAATGGCVG
jgi:RHS repeat-associated protein